MLSPMSVILRQLETAYIFTQTETERETERERDHVKAESSALLGGLWNSSIHPARRVLITQCPQHAVIIEEGALEELQPADVVARAAESTEGIPTPYSKQPYNLIRNPWLL